MPSFAYSAYDARGGLAQGRIEAASADAASEALWARGLTAFRLSDLERAGTPWWRREVLTAGARRAEVAGLTRELATLIGADIPLDDCLRILADKATSRSTRTLASDLRSEVLDGSTLSDALQRRPQLFTSDYVSVVRAGETGGALGQVFEELATLLEQRQEVRARIQSALVYPCILLGLSAVSLAVIIGVLVPSIAPVFAQGGKPLPRAIALLASLQARWPEILIGIAVAVASALLALRYALRRPGLRLALDRTLLAMPVAGALLLEQETARFARTLGTLLRAGVPLLQAAASAHGTTGNTYLAAGLQRAIGLVREGASLGSALQRETALPPIALRMIAISEEAGKLEGMLITLASMLEKQTQRSIDRLMTLLTPLLTVGVAVLVGSLIMTVMNAVLSINQIAVR